MEIRKTLPGDLLTIGQLYNEARAALKAAGIDQWQTGDYPSAYDAQLDMENGVGYVLEDDSRILGVAVLAFGHEPTYDVIEQGSWLTNAGEYGFLHRIAVSGEAKGKGVAGMFFEELKRQARKRGIKVIRGDTHKDNLSMQRVMAKAGLEYRGIIHVEDGTPRFAYELILP